MHQIIITNSINILAGQHINFEKKVVIFFFLIPCKYVTQIGEFVTLENSVFTVFLFVCNITSVT